MRRVLRFFLDRRGSVGYASTMIRTVNGKKTLLSWIALGAVLAPLFLVSARVVVSGAHDLAVEGDLAMLDISTRNLAEGRSLLGPYSRFGFNHPGPLYLLLRLPACLFTGWSGSASYITVPVIIAGCLTAAFLLVRGICGGTVSIAFCLASLLYILQTSPVVWLRDWNPFVIIFPFLLFVLASAASASGRTGWFPAAVASGSLVAQTHIGGAPVVLAVLLFILPVRRLFCPVERKDAIRVKRAVLFGAVLALILWLPVLVEELAPGEGNLARIFRFMGENPSATGFRAALREWSGAVTNPETWLLAPRYLRSRGILFQAVLALAMLRLFLAGACAFILKRNGKCPFIGSLAALLLVAHLSMLFAVLQVRGELNEYLFCWFGVTSPLSMLVFVGTIAALAPRRTSGLRVLPVVLAALTALPAFLLAERLGVFGKDPFDPLCYHDEDVAELSDRLGAFLAVEGDRSWFLEPAPRELWPVSAGVVNRLAARGEDIHPDPFFGSLVGTAPPQNAIPLVLSRTGASARMDVDTLCTFGEFTIGLPGGAQ